YHKMIFKSLREASEAVRSVEYVIIKGDSRKHVEEESKKKRWSGMELPLQDLYINKEDNLNPRYTFDNFVVGSFNELAYAASQTVIKNPGHTYNPLFVYGGSG